jgi:Uma2 family endonuclease
MAETGIHVQRIIYLITALNGRYQENPQVYVIGNIFIYYEEGDPSKSVSPDTFVVFGVPKRERRTYKTWEEGKVPDVVFEVTSKKTRRQDLQTKWELYARLGVQEYFLFDPLEEYLEPPLQGYRLIEGGYLPIPSEPTVEGGLAVQSAVLGLIVRKEGSWPILYDAVTGERLLTPEELLVARREAETRAHQAETRAHHEATARRAAEEGLQCLKAEIARLRQGTAE